MTQTPPAGWYPDPAGGGGQRWWDGVAWSEHVQPAPAAAPAATYAPAASTVVPRAPAAPGAMPQAWAPVGSPMRTQRSNNHYAFITFGFAALYILLAVATHVVLIGVVPILMAVRSLRSRESLAPVAMAVAVITVIVAAVTLSGH